MEWVTLKSSNVAAARYLEEEKILEVRFTNGAEYQYLDVPKELFESLQEAESVGRFFGENLRGKYESKRKEKEDTDGSGSSDK